MLIQLFEAAPLAFIHDISLMVLPEILCQLASDPLELVSKTIFPGNAEPSFQCPGNGILIFFFIFPKPGSAGILFFACIGHIEYIAQPGISVFDTDQADTLRAAADITAHTPVPNLVRSAGRNFGTLGMDQELIRERVSVYPGCSI